MADKMICEKCGGKMRKLDEKTLECTECGNIVTNESDGLDEAEEVDEDRSGKGMI